MQEDNTSIVNDNVQGYFESNPAAQAAPAVKSSVIVEPDIDSLNSKKNNNEKVANNKNIYVELDDKIKDSKNILIALSSNPSVDEMAAAIGLSLYLDRLGKRATAIYSGVTPNALEFLKPEETFESTADALQDFVIAINREKADHLRYKLDGEFVKIYITPYRSRISEDDLDFSYGDFNVDLVLALDVDNGIDLDSALREHGRIMHDAVIVNISTSKPGKFGEIEWSDKAASSVSEMIAKLLYNMKNDIEVGKEEATAFLTGIVAATNRFSNASTTPETMQIAGRLMKSGANQQLVSKNITPDVENEIMYLEPNANIDDKEGGGDADDLTKLKIDHDGNIDINNSKKEINADIADRESTLLDDLKAAEASLATAGSETIEDPNDNPVKIDISEKKDSSDATPEEPVFDAEELNTPEDEQVVYDTDEGSIDMEDPEIFNMNKLETAPAGADTTVEDDTVEGETTVGAEGLGVNEPVAATEESGAENLEIDEPVVTEEDSGAGELNTVTEEEESKSGGSESEVDGSVDFSSENNLEEEQPTVENEAKEESAGEKENEGYGGKGGERVIKPESGFESELQDGFAEDKYGHMLEDALNSGNDFGGNIAAAGAPNVPSVPEINGVPEINYASVPNEGVLPPPPPPMNMNGNIPQMPPTNIDSVSQMPATNIGNSIPQMPQTNMNMNTPMGQGQFSQNPQSNNMVTPALPAVEPILPAMPSSEPTLTSLGSQPAMQDQVYGAQANDPGAFKIPGM